MQYRIVYADYAKDVADHDYWKLSLPTASGLDEYPGWALSHDDEGNTIERQEWKRTEKTCNSLAGSLPAGRHYAIQLRLQRGVLIYDCCSDEELRHFGQQRGISYLGGSANREDMIEALESADDEGATFRKFLDLPPELQMRVYDFYKSSLGSRFGLFSVAPPITAVSKLVRQGAASVFFRDRMFICSFQSSWSSNGTVRHIEPYMEEVTRLFFDKAPLCFVEQVRRLEIMAPLPEPHSVVQNPGCGYAEWLVDLSAKTREARVVFEGVGSFSQRVQSPHDLERIIGAVKEGLRDVVDAIVSRDRLALRRTDANAILAALVTLPSDMMKRAT